MIITLMKLVTSVGHFITTYQIGCVHSSLRRPGADEVVDFVNKENSGWRFGIRHFLYNGLQPFLEFTPVFRTGYQSGQF